MSVMTALGALPQPAKPSASSIVAKFRKLGGKVSLTEKIHTSSKNRNYIHQMVLSL